MKPVSCAPFLLYENRVPVEETSDAFNDLLKQSLQRISQIAPVSKVYSEEKIERTSPPLFLGADAAWEDVNCDFYYKGVSGNFLPGSFLCLLKNTYVNNNALYFGGSIETAMLYEMYRPTDRPSTAINYNIHLRQATRLDSNADGRIYLLLISAGTSNYGHWLTDDLPRVKAAVFLKNCNRDKKVTILLTSYGQEIDAVRQKSINSHPDLTDVEVFFLDRAVNYVFEEIFYVSPVSYHPVMKLRAAVDYVRTCYAKHSHKGPTRRLFVTRPKQSLRHLTNIEEVEDIARASGYEVIECGNMDFDTQVSTFSEASSVVGIMGAAMTNTIFSPSSAEVTYLACTGWIEPYYWDLADACGHRCTYLFGPSAEPDKPPYLARFSVDTNLLKSVL